MGRRRSILKANATITNSHESSICGLLDETTSTDAGGKKRRVSFNNSMYVRPIAKIGGEELLQTTSENRNHETDSGRVHDYELPTRFKSAEENSEDFETERQFLTTPVHRAITDITEASSVVDSVLTSTKFDLGNTGVLSNDPSIHIPSAPLSQPLSSNDYSFVPLQPKMSLDSLKGGMSNLNLSYSNNNRTLELSDGINGNVTDVNGRSDEKLSDYRYAPKLSSTEVSSSKASIELLLNSQNNVAEMSAASVFSNFEEQHSEFSFLSSPRNDVLSQNMAELNVKSKIFTEAEKKTESVNKSMKNLEGVESSLIFSDHDDQSFSPQVANYTNIDIENRNPELPKASNKELPYVKLSQNLTDLFEHEQSGMQTSVLANRMLEKSSDCSQNEKLSNETHTKKPVEKHISGKSAIGSEVSKGEQKSFQKRSEVKSGSENQASMTLSGQQKGANNISRDKSTPGNSSKKSPLDKLRESCGDSKGIKKRSLRMLNRENSARLAGKPNSRLTVISQAVPLPMFEPMVCKPDLKNAINIDERVDFISLSQPRKSAHVCEQYEAKKNKIAELKKLNTELKSAIDLVKPNHKELFDDLKAILVPVCVRHCIKNGSSNLEPILMELDPQMASKIEEGTQTGMEFKRAEEKLEDAKESAKIGRSLKQQFGDVSCAIWVNAKQLEMEYDSAIKLALSLDKKDPKNPKFSKLISVTATGNKEKYRSKTVNRMVKLIEQVERRLRGADIAKTVQVLFMFLQEGLLVNEKE